MSLHLKLCIKLLVAVSSLSQQHGENRLFFTVVKNYKNYLLDMCLHLEGSIKLLVTVATLCEVGQVKTDYFSL